MMIQTHATRCPVSAAAAIPLPFPCFTWRLPAIPRLALRRVAPFPGFARTSARRCGIALLTLLTMGLIGLAWAVVDLNGRYEVQSRHIGTLRNELRVAHLQLAGQKQWAERQRERIRRFDQLAFQVEAFRRYAPQFARILQSVQQQSPRFGFHPSLILGIIQVESSFNPLAVSLAGACGLMQVHYDTWKNELRIDRRRLFDVEYNIELGLTILRHYLQESRGNIHKAMIMYNAGYRAGNPDYPRKVSRNLYCADLPTHEMTRGVSE
jgi:hypothetical protein